MLRQVARGWLTSAQVALILAVLLDAAPGDMQLELGVRLRRATGAFLGWDAHRTGHATLSVWGPLLVVAAGSAPVVYLAWAFLRRRLQPARMGRLGRLVDLLGPWLVLALTGRAGPGWLTALLMGLPLGLWFRQEAAEVKEVPFPWPVAVSLPAWWYFLSYGNPWYRPITVASLVLAAVGTLDDLCMFARTPRARGQNATSRA